MKTLSCFVSILMLLSCPSCSTTEKIDIGFVEAQGYILPASACQITMRGITNEVADTIKYESADYAWLLHMTFDDTGSYVPKKNSGRIKTPWYNVRVKGRDLILRVEANTGHEREIIILLSCPGYEGAFGPKITQAGFHAMPSE